MYTVRKYVRTYAQIAFKRASHLRCLVSRPFVHVRRLCEISLALEQLPWDKTGRRRERLELEKVPEPVLKKIRHGKAKFPVQEKGAPKIYPSVEHNPDGMVIKFSELLSVDVLHVPEVLERMSLAKTGIACLLYTSPSPRD